jgi:FkbM family methyltransferase
MKRLKSILRNIRYRLYKTPHEKVVYDWIAKHGDKTRRLDYCLTENSIVLDLGGYEGQWASDIFAMYLCEVIVFEPVKDFATKMRERFLRNPNIKVVEAAAGEGESVMELHHSADASSAFDVGGNVVLVKKLDLLDYLTRLGVVEVDLVKMNIEGGEYELLEYLIKTRALPRFKNLQIQFHRCVPNAEQRAAEIRKHLARTHTLEWEFPFVWESWRKVD